WKPENANASMASAISALGKGKIVGVYSANDGMAGGVITALKAAGVNPLPPVTGQDAELAGVQRIVAGEQFMTVYKRYAPEAAAAAEMAVALAKGEKIDGIINQFVDSPTTKRVPAVLVPGISLTKANVKATVVDDGVYTVAEICTDKLRAACEDLGLK
ncbi:substrate-binding domain-containing protein, partial [Streptomyces sp. NPDC048270]|uniref:substrate-binding domain-containing protein n=1 Tax=Streptomyces sp. NPDC048270 TaxID=3154615 RepID=UPI0033C36CCB